jgi:hypothetical protein
MIKDETIKKGGVFLYRFISLGLMFIMFVMVVHCVNHFIPIDFGGKNAAGTIFLNMLIDGVFISIYAVCIRDYFRTTKKTE